MPVAASTVVVIFNSASFIVSLLALGLSSALAGALLASVGDCPEAAKAADPGPDLGPAAKLFQSKQYAAASRAFRILAEVHSDDARVWYYAALANGLPIEFFARVIWQESRFRAA